MFSNYEVESHKAVVLHNTEYRFPDVAYRLIKYMLEETNETVGLPSLSLSSCSARQRILLVFLKQNSWLR